MLHSRVNLNLQPFLPPVDLPGSVWSLNESCRVASHLYNTIYAAVTAGLIRDFGHEATYRAHALMLRHHQKSFFLTGLAKLELDDEVSDAVRCAKYHSMSNALGGVRTRYAIESADKCWLFYYPHTIDNPWPGQAAAVHTAGNMLSDYEGWHGNNGEILGNPGLVYVATHFIAEGDPFDGGYFLDTHAPVPEEQRVRLSRHEAIPSILDFRGLDLPADKWPADRVSKALRNYAVTWAADRIWSVCHFFESEAHESIRKSMSTALFSWLPRLNSMFAAKYAGEDPLQQWIEIFAGVHRLTGAGVSIRPSRTGWIVRLERPLETYIGGEVSLAELQAFRSVVANVWKNLSDYYAGPVHLDVRDGAEWHFSPAGGD